MTHTHTPVHINHFLNETEKQITLVSGPLDTQLNNSITMKYPLLVPQIFDLVGLQKKIKNFEGTILCFNSFFAHFTHYLEQKAIVMHQNAVPHGYDCSSVHRQIILKDSENLDLSEVFEALG